MHYHQTNTHKNPNIRYNYQLLGGYLDTSKDLSLDYFQFRTPPAPHFELLKCNLIQVNRKYTPFSNFIHFPLQRAKYSYIK